MNEEFEKWATGKVGSLARGPNGGYQYFDAARAWEAWQTSRKQAVEECASLCDNFVDRVLRPAGKYRTMDVDCYPETAAACAEAIRALQKD